MRGHVHTELLPKRPSERRLQNRYQTWYPVICNKKSIYKIKLSIATLPKMPVDRSQQTLNKSVKRAILTLVMCKHMI